MRKLLVALIAVCFLIFSILESQPANTLDSYDKALIEYLMSNTIPDWIIINEFSKDIDYDRYALTPYEDNKILEEGVIYVYDFYGENGFPFEVTDEITSLTYSWIRLDITIRENNFSKLMPRDIESNESDPNVIGITDKNVEVFYFWMTHLKRRIKVPDRGIYQLGIWRSHDLVAFRPKWGRRRVILFVNYTDWDVKQFEELFSEQKD